MSYLSFPPSLSPYPFPILPLHYMYIVSRAYWSSVTGCLSIAHSGQMSTPESLHCDFAGSGLYFLAVGELALLPSIIFSLPITNELLS